MPRLNGTGPEMEGPQTGRKLGRCSDTGEENISQLGKGMGKRRNAGGGTGLSKRLRYDLKK